MKQQLEEKEPIDNLEVQKEDTDKFVATLEKAREKLNSRKELSEFDIPTELREEWVKHNSKFLNEQIEIGYSQQEEITSSINFFEFENSDRESMAIDEVIECEIEDNKFKTRGINLDEMEKNKDVILPIIANKEDRSLFY